MKALTPRTWSSLLKTNDDETLLHALHRLVSAHPMVRSAQRNQNNPANPAPLFSTRDLTQDLYLSLLEKSRFEHYLNTRMSDGEIEREIFQIELTNLLVGRLRRQRPENYRIIRRINQILETSPLFRAFQTGSGRGKAAHYRPPSSLFYGLSEWPDDKAVRDSGIFTEMIREVPARLRNRRLVGCRGEAQVIVTSQDLSQLLLEIFRAVDSPISLNTLRSLAVTKLPVFDITLTAIEEDNNSDEGHNRGLITSLTSVDFSPEQQVIRHEQEMQAREAAREFLDRLEKLTRANPQRTERLWRVLWHCYFDPAQPSQLSIAEMVGVSDSSVSDYRRRIEGEMRKLGFAQEHLRMFAEELDEQLRKRLQAPVRKKEQPRRKPERTVIPAWSGYGYAAASAKETAPVI
ncbi:MAG: hypothetical protein ACKV2V_22955 [Blastocatellia bacterium]